MIWLRPRLPAVNWIPMGLREDKMEKTCEVCREIKTIEDRTLEPTATSFYLKKNLNNPWAQIKIQKNQAEVLTALNTLHGSLCFLYWIYLDYLGLTVFLSWFLLFDLKETPHDVSSIMKDNHEKIRWQIVFSSEPSIKLSRCTVI